MGKSISVDGFVEGSLDKINAAGEKIGKKLGFVGLSAHKVIFGAVVLVVFGIAAFIWAVLNGMANSKK